MQIDWFWTLVSTYGVGAAVFHTVLTFFAAAWPKTALGQWVNKWDGEENPPWPLIVLFWPVIPLIVGAVVPFLGLFAAIDALGTVPRKLGKRLHARGEQKKLPKARVVPRE